MAWDTGYQGNFNGFPASNRAGLSYDTHFLRPKNAIYRHKVLPKPTGEADSTVCSLPVPAQNHFSECSSSGPGLRQTAYLEIAPKCQLPTAEGETDDLSVVPGENLKSGRPTSE